MERRRRERAEQTAYKLEQEIALWDPTTNARATMDPFKTLFVARIVSNLALSIVIIYLSIIIKLMSLFECAKLGNYWFDLKNCFCVG